MSTQIEPTAGVTLAAADAITHQQTFTRNQVSYLIRLAYDAGRTARLREDLAEIHCTWDDSTQPRLTHEQAVAARIAEMEAHGRQRAAREGRQRREYRGGPVDFETGEPVRTLRSVA